MLAMWLLTAVKHALVILLRWLLFDHVTACLLCIEYIEVVHLELERAKVTQSWDDGSITTGNQGRGDMLLNFVDCCAFFACLKTKLWVFGSQVLFACGTCRTFCFLVHSLSLPSKATDCSAG